MNENLPMKEEKGLFIKIKNFFRNLFYKPVGNNNLNEVKEEDIKQENNVQKDKFENMIKVEVKDEYLVDIKKSEFIKEIEKNPNLLYNLSNEKIEKLSQYYDELIKQNKADIDNLKQEIKKLKKVS